MLRSGIWRNKSQSSVCTACKRGLWRRHYPFLGQARTYSDDPAPRNPSPNSTRKVPEAGGKASNNSSWDSFGNGATSGKIPGVVAVGGWGGGGASSLIRQNAEPFVVGGLLPHERRAREEAARAKEEEARVKAEAARAKDEAARAKKEAARAEREAARAEREKAQSNRPARISRQERTYPSTTPNSRRGGLDSRQQPQMHRSNPEPRSEHRFSNRARENGQQLPRQPLATEDNTQEWGHIRRRESRTLPFEIPTREQPRTTGSGGSYGQGQGDQQGYGNEAFQRFVSQSEPSSRYPRQADFGRRAGNSKQRTENLDKSATISSLPFEMPTREDQQRNRGFGGAAAKAPIAETPDEVWTRVQDRMRSDESIGAYPNETSDGFNTNPNFGKSSELADRGTQALGSREYERARKPRNTRYSKQDDDFDEESFEERRRRRAAEKARKKREQELAAAQAGPVPIFLPEYISIANLGDALGVKQNQFLRQLEELGFEDINADSIMTGETAALVAQEYGFEPTVDSGENIDLRPRPAPEDPSMLPPRPPVVTIMGHVDHGKTTLLDYLRKSSVAASEHGGITQHIGAFSVKLSSGKPITFLDTPGHAAFLTMRQRGANVTDIVILVVAADDSVKPQTIEALKHARAAKVPIIVAINKVDKEEARIDLVKSDLAKNGVEIEDYGGDVQTVLVSGKTGQGMEDLEESILSLSEILDLRAEPDGMAEGWVLESVVKPVGRAATVLVKRGTLRKGDFIVAGKVFAKIRSLRSEAGEDIDEAPPGTPVEILGWRDLPDAGDEVLQAPDEEKAKDAVEYRRELSDRGEAVAQMAQQDLDRREREREKADKAAAEELDQGEEGEGDKEEVTGTTMVHFLVRGDVHGSVEAVCAATMEIGNNEVQPRILQSGPGLITESDVEYAAVSGSNIINFNNPIPGHIKRMAEESNVKILDYNIIYHLVDAIKDTLSEKLKPTVSTKVVGEAEVLQLFPINLRGRVYKNIAGCRIRNGHITRNAKYRVIRKGENIFEGTIDSLKHGKKDVSEMRKGSECGISFEGWDELRQGDQIQAFEEITEKRHL